MGDRDWKIIGGEGLEDNWGRVIGRINGGEGMEG